MRLEGRALPFEGIASAELTETRSSCGSRRWQLRPATPNSHVRAAGVVTHRQRPATASGVTFINLEDETGFVNVIVSPGCFIRSKRIITSSAALIIRGGLERSQGVTNLVADKIERLPIAMRSASRDWR
ncbi:OB-fold nucleic acid binding domain-containing protein [Kribbella sp. CA-294648]|uniref:OB-fold nucleic acid binding domain-containing protein n=1 Tax=Kribbella sp. CA-294648 TaxID=3239948 RepID=UPI003D8DC390